MISIESIRLAIPKGNRAVSTLFRTLGYALPDDFDDSRKYIVSVADRNVEFILAKPVDIPTYVEYGAADLGIVSKELLMEADRDVYELLDLGRSMGHLSVLGMSSTTGANPRVATSYPNVARWYFTKRGMQVEIIQLSGELELALITGAADCIIEVHDKQISRHLIELERICDISLRLIANRVSFQIKNARIGNISEELSKILG